MTIEQIQTIKNLVEIHNLKSIAPATILILLENSSFLTSAIGTEMNETDKQFLRHLQNLEKHRLEQEYAAINDKISCLTVDTIFMQDLSSITNISPEVRTDLFK